MKAKNKAAPSRRRSPLGLSAKRSSSLLFSFRASPRAVPTPFPRSSRRRNGKVARLPQEMREKLEADPHNFVRLLTLLPKLTTTSLECERQRLEAADALPENRTRTRLENLERLGHCRNGTMGEPMQVDVGQLAEPPPTPDERS
jgi:hypothetical protein